MLAQWRNPEQEEMYQKRLPVVEPSLSKAEQGSFHQIVTDLDEQGLVAQKRQLVSLLYYLVGTGGDPYGAKVDYSSESLSGVRGAESIIPGVLAYVVELIESHRQDPSHEMDLNFGLLKRQGMARTPYFINENEAAATPTVFQQNMVFVDPE